MITTFEQKIKVILCCGLTYFYVWGLTYQNNIAMASELAMWNKGK